MLYLERDQHLWRRRIIAPTAVLLLQAVCCVSLAATGMQQYIVRSWSADDGLPHNYILSLIQGRHGYLWVGTRSGLARFDGVRFTPVAWGPMKGSQIGSLCETRDGSLWIALEGHGLVRWNEHGMAEYTHNNGLNSNFVRAICEGENGTIWIATRGGLTRYRKGQFRTFTPKDGLAGPLAEALCADAEGNIWVGSSGGLNCIKDGAVTATLTTRDGLPANSVTALCTDHNGSLWIGTSEGLVVRAGGRIQTGSFPGKDGAADAGLTKSSVPIRGD